MWRTVFRAGAFGLALVAFLVGTPTSAALAAGPASGMTRYDQTDSRLSYSGNWVLFTKAAAWNGAYARANSSGASVTIRFNGTQIDWIAMKGVTTGKADVYLDGVLKATVDLANSTAIYQQDVWSTGTLTTGLHTVKIVRNATSATGKYVPIDAADVAGTLVPAAAPSVGALAAIVIDASTGTVLYARNADTRRAMASTTKIMTTILAIDGVSLTKVVTVSARAAAVGGTSPWLKAGDRVTVEQLLYGALVAGENEAAFVLSEATSGTMEAFVTKMNQEASTLGLTNTHYVNPVGFDASGHYTSARDLATLARYAMQNAEFRKIVGTVSFTITLPGHSTPSTYYNDDQVLGSLSGATGIKAGLTTNAGHCFTGSCTQSGKSVISVVLGESSWTSTYADSRDLLQYGINSL